MRISFVSQIQKASFWDSIPVLLIENKLLIENPFKYTFGSEKFLGSKKK